MFYNALFPIWYAEKPRTLLRDVFAFRDLLHSVDEFQQLGRLLIWRVLAFLRTIRPLSPLLLYPYCYPQPTLEKGGQGLHIADYHNCDIQTGRRVYHQKSKSKIPYGRGGDDYSTTRCRTQTRFAPLSNSNTFLTLDCRGVKPRAYSLLTKIVLFVLGYIAKTTCQYPFPDFNRNDLLTQAIGVCQ